MTHYRQVFKTRDEADSFYTSLTDIPRDRKLVYVNAKGFYVVAWSEG